MDTLRTFIMVAMPVATIFLLFVLPYLRRNKKVETVQDLLGKDSEVRADGLIHDKATSTFRYVIEVLPINLGTSSMSERAIQWTNFRGLVNTLGFPYTLLIQSQYLDMKDYSAWYKEKYENNPLLTEELIKAAHDRYEYFMNMDEEQNTRDYKCYIVLHFSPLSDSIDSGVRTGLNVLDDFVGQQFNSQKNMPAEELIDLSYQILEESKDHVFSYCEQAGMQYRLLDRAGVFQVNYQMLQKKLSIYSKVRDAVDARSFTANVDSLTKKTLQKEFGGDNRHAG